MPPQSPNSVVVAEKPSPGVSVEVSPLERLKTHWLYRFRNNHRVFFSDAVWTQDQADKINPIKKFPSEEEKPHTYVISDYMVNEALFATVKHRRMLVSWTGCGVMTWDALFFESRFNAILSKKEEDADELVRRCKFIFENIPDSAMPKKPRMVYKYAQLEFPETGSIIKGFAQGPDQLRQYTCSRILADEMAFWERAQATFVAMKPTIEGGGKITIISTRYPGFFKNLVEDKLDE